MFEMPTQEQVDEIVRRAHYERGIAMRDGVRWMGRQISSPFRIAARRPSDQRS